MYEGQEMPQMDVRSSGGLIAKRAQYADAPQPSKQETAASILEQCHKYASIIGSNTTSIAHGAGGPIPCNAQEGCDKQAPSLINSLRELRNYLSDIAEESQRARTILGV